MGARDRRSAVDALLVFLVAFAAYAAVAAHWLQINPLSDEPHHVVDAGFPSRGEVEAVAQRGVTLYGPLPARKGKPDPYAPQRGDSEAMRALKERMQTERTSRSIATGRRRPNWSMPVSNTGVGWTASPSAGSPR